MPGPPPDGDETTPEPAPRPRTGCGWLIVGLYVSPLVGMALAFAAVLAKAPMWAVGVALFGPPVLYFLAAAALVFPRVLHAMREATRNAPSPESVAAAARGAGVEAGARPAPAATAEPDDTPTVPAVPTHPGKTLAHRLARADIPASCQFGCSILFATFWNGIVAVFVFQLARKWNRGGAFRWFEAAFLVPFALVGLGLVVFVLYSAFRLIVAVLVGRVGVELDAHPLVPGRKGRARVTQAGLFPLSQVHVWLVCTEEASYMAGTSKSTAKEDIARHAVANPDHHLDGGGLPLEADFTVPADAMHSFEAPNNAIKWTVVVTGRVLGLPFWDSYAVAVAPSGQRSEDRDQRTEARSLGAG